MIKMSTSAFKALPLSLTLGLALNLVGCASGGPKAKDSKLELPIYREHVDATRASQLKNAAECPADGAFEKESMRTQVAMANACVKKGDYARVEKIGDRLASTSPQTPWGAYFLSLAASSRKDYPRAQWMLELALKKAPNEGLLHFELARLNWTLGQDAVAIAEMKRASELNASLFDAHLTLGQLALGKGDLSEARKYLDRAELVDSVKLELLLTRAEVEMRGQDYAKAEHYLGEAVSHYPSNTKARLGLAQIQEQHLNKSADALQNYRQLKSLSADRKLDGTVPTNLDARIQALEKTLSQVAPSANGNRQPSAER